MSNSTDLRAAATTAFRTRSSLSRDDLPSALAQLDATHRRRVLLHSAAAGHPLSNTSYIASNPVMEITATHGVARIKEPNGGHRTEARDGVKVLLEILDQGPPQRIAVGYLAYEYGAHFENTPRAAPTAPIIPDLWFGIYDQWAALHHAPEPATLAIYGEGETADALRACLSRPAPASGHQQGGVGEPSRLWTRERYGEAFCRVMSYIRAGDIYQANLAQPFTLECPLDPLRIYDRLSRNDPMPYGAYLDCGDFSLISLSPECFLECAGGRIRTMPIKGTARRARPGAEDQRLRDALTASAKDQAEHIMIVDLERNDLGRISRIGSVRVTDALRLESYRHVHHLVSTVEGTLRHGVGLLDILRATFPGGSITGAPKIRAMEIIAEVEGAARGVYTGAIGLIRRDGNAHLSIAIRTAVAEEGVLYYHAGGGIVADSDCAQEYDECLQKARSFSVLAAEDPHVGGH